MPGMAILHIRDVPEETVDVLKARAQRANQSLQAYVRTIIDREVSVMTWEEVEEVLAPIRARSKVTTDDIIEAIRLGREEREAELWGREAEL
jgi:antitoxin FitA